jgi:UDP-N-acetylglucosamine diphosphorylase / glucose-1-phosphate thymidylyltransferase / UDP-N-acetylgalactosamine diphosphorylase / glucosamine-1-phosphate N-acetyltransferase / galactosamine-1-phosphate N-acetyltransferase
MADPHMNIVMPMAWRGSRFAEVGYRVPKPLIDVRGRPMYAWAMDSLPLDLAKRVIFICLEEHLRDHTLEADIRARYASLQPIVISLDHVTQGQACTVLEARKWIDNDDELIIYNADTYCRTSLSARLPRLPASVVGLLSVFEAPGDKWSFARTDADGRVVETAEKRRISPWATTGLYYFRHGRQFVEHTDRMIAADERERGEFYVAPVYNRLIASGGDVRIDVADEVWVLGTPEDLADFQQRYPST